MPSARQPTQNLPKLTNLNLPTHAPPDAASHDPLLATAVALERAALEDPYFQSHRLYPNVEFYSGIVLRALGIPISMRVGGRGARGCRGAAPGPWGASRLMRGALGRPESLQRRPPLKPAPELLDLTPGDP
jgi:hypothetical protein